GIFKDLNEGYIQAWMKAVKAQFLLWPVIDSVSIAGISLVFVVSVSWISQGFTGITAGIVVAFMGYISRFWEPVSNLGNFYNAIINAIAYLERIFETNDEQPLVDDLPEAVEMPLIEGKVRFNHVNFSYEKGERRILKDVSFSVEKGETIALVGPTGAGKTTIVNLLSRFYDVESGQVIIDETDVRSVTLNSLRKQMGVMLQDSFIFSGTIMDNIRYSKLDATDEEVIKATKAVKAHDFIIEMEEGYNTEVNERGSRLSAGQRQLISFARALLADPKILILDEATSSISQPQAQLILRFPSVNVRVSANFIWHP
ncbi:MAG: ABC transporter ATP-binding protein, partial [Candidatus Margulisbacteria bacterium]|nr:ABC transporter ATP-binding protein [Candidatus Margulisiibacteriota bacterium]